MHIFYEATVFIFIDWQEFIRLLGPYWRVSILELKDYDQVRDGEPRQLKQNQVNAKGEC